MATIEKILGMSREQRISEYKAVGIEKVVIDGNEFTDYSAFSFLWEKSYVKSPTRSGSGTIGNLNSYATFLTPHLKIDFSLMSIDSYRTLMKLIYSKNEFTVTCYDIVNNKSTTNKMYFSTEEMPKLWTIVDALNGDENAIMLLGVQDYTVEMIGTNANVDSVTANYYLNSPTGVGQTTPIFSEDVAIGSEIVLGSGTGIDTYTFDGYAFNGKWRLGSASGTLYNHNDGFAIEKPYIDESSNSINFYADWQSTNTYTLTYSYGLGTPKIDTTTMQEITNKEVQNGIAIGELPDSATPSVQYGEKGKEKTYYPYSNGGWYKTSIRGDNSEKLTASTPYWLNSSTTIYQLYDISSYQVTYIVDGNTYSTVQVEYGTSIPMPRLIKSGYTFKGWEFTYEGKSQTLTSMKMPPFAITLTAIFEENKQ